MNPESIILSCALYHAADRKQVFTTLDDLDFISNEALACFSMLRIAYEAQHFFDSAFMRSVESGYGSLINFESTAGDLSEAIKELKTASIKKRVTDQFIYGQTVVGDPITPVSHIKELCGHMLDIASSADGIYKPIPSMQATLKESWARIERVKSGEEKFYTLALEGLECVKLAPGDLCVIAGRPAQGKTAISLDIARQVSTQGIKCAFICLETDATTLTWRLLSQQSNVPYSIIQDGTINATEGQLTDLSRATAEIQQLPINIISRYKQSINDITSMCKQLKAQGYEMIFIDYLQKIEESKASRNRFDAVARISSELKNIALEQNLVIIPLAQLNRDTENTMPRMSNLSESARIEQDASAILLIDRPDALNPPPLRNYKKGETKITEENLKGRLAMIIAKNRNGATGIRFYDHDMSCFKIISESNFNYKPKGVS